MSNYFTMYKIVAVLAFAYCSSYHCYYLSDYKLGVHMYCLWPPHFYKLGVHVYCLWPPHYYKLGTHRGEESPWMTASCWRQKQIFLAPFISLNGCSCSPLYGASMSVLHQSIKHIPIPSRHHSLSQTCSIMY